MKSYWSEDIEKGDLILISFEYSADLGFYLGKGKGNSCQYYGLNNIHPCLEETSKLIPYKAYISSNTYYRLAKYSPELLNDEQRKKYDEVLKFLQSLKILNK